MSNCIVFLCNCLHNGGAQRVLVSIANYMAEHGYEVHIVASFDNGSYPLHPSIQVRYIGEGQYWRFVRESRKEIKRLQPKAVIAFEYFFDLLASMACMGLKTFVIGSERNDPARVGSGIIKDRIRNFLYRFLDVLVCQTPDAKAYFPDYIQRKTVVIPNPLKPNLPVKETKDRLKEVVTFCRLNVQKNLPMLLQAFKIFHDTHTDYKLKIYGDGEEKVHLDKLIGELSLKSCVEIYPAEDNVHNKVIDAAMFVLPSDYEGLSNSMLEAIAIGLPSICTDCPCGGARMIIKEGTNGKLIPVGDTNALIKAMTTLADHPELGQFYSVEGQKLREELSVESISKKWISLFEK